MNDINQRIRHERRMMAVSVITIAFAAAALILLFIVLLSNIGIIKLPENIADSLGLGDGNTETLNGNYDAWLIDGLEYGVIEEYDISVLNLSGVEAVDVVANFEIPSECTIKSDVYTNVESSEQKYKSITYKSGNLVRVEVYGADDTDKCLKVALISMGSEGSTAEYYDFQTETGISYSKDEICYLPYECRPVIFEYILSINSDAEKDIQKLRTQTENVFFLTIYVNNGNALTEERYYIDIETGMITAAAVYTDAFMTARAENISLTDGISGYNGEREYMFSRFK